LFVTHRILLLRAPTTRAKNNPAMADDITTRPMLEALLEGQRHLGSQMAELIATQATMSKRQDEMAAKQDECAAQQNTLAAKQDEFAAKLDGFDTRIVGLEGRLVALTREVRDGFDEYNRRVDALNKRLLSFETWLSRIDDRLHEEIIARTR
jgi:uncharacterized protein (DUF1501 family)